MNDKITVCPSCGTPVINTFAFNYNEKWCPKCSAMGDIFWGHTVEATLELKQALDKYTEDTKEYLGARCKLVCSSTLWKGKRVAPKDLPKEELDRLQKIVLDFERIENKQ